MKKKIVILGSTGSIGKTTFNIIKQDKKNFEVVLLATNKNVNEIMKQIKIFNVKNYLCWGTPNDYKTYQYWLEYFKKNI